MGPSDAARQAMVEIIPRGGRYLFSMEEELTEIFAKQEGLDPQSVMAFAGSSEPLHYTVLAFTSKDRPLVIADPGYEAPMWAAKVSGASVIKVPLSDPKGAASHDIKAMLAAASNPGVIYICNPNNPTGTCTPRSDIEYAVANAPKDTILLIDEAYIHLCDAPRSIDFVKEGKNVIVLRTFSKLYGMAGIRMGLVIGRPDLFGQSQPVRRNEFSASHRRRCCQSQLARSNPRAHSQKNHRRHSRADSRLVEERRLRNSRHQRAIASCSTFGVLARRCKRPSHRKKCLSDAFGPHGPTRYALPSARQTR